jgi:outer membrane lipoprotein LolB
MNRRTAQLSLLALWLAGCASPPPAPPQGWSGKLGYQTEASNGQRAQAGSALFELQGDAQEGSLLLNSPLGTALAQARWNSQGLWLEDSQGPRRFANMGELGEALGNALQGPALPLQLLFDWLQGRPNPTLPHETLDVGFEQEGWRVQREDSLRLLLSRPSQGSQGALRLRILLTPPA